MYIGFQSKNFLKNIEKNESKIFMFKEIYNLPNKIQI